MKVLYIFLLLSIVAVLGAAVAAWWRVRQHMKQAASDTMLRRALTDLEEEQERARQRSR